MKEIPTCLFEYLKQDSARINTMFKEDNVEEFKEIIAELGKLSGYSLIEKSNKEEIACHGNSSVLLQAIHNKSLKICEYLIDTYPELLYTKSYDQDTPCQALLSVMGRSFTLDIDGAIAYFKEKHRFKKLFKSMFEHDIDYHKTSINKSGDNLLSTAVANLNSTKFFNYLLKNGFDINTLNPVNGDTLLHVIANSIYKKSPFLSIIANDSNYKFSIDEKNKLGETPFLISVMNQNFNYIEFFLKKNANVLEKTNNGCNALHYFSKCNNIFYGAFTSYSKYKNKINQQLNFSTFLLNKGIDINEKDLDGRTALLHFAKEINATSRLYFLKFLYNNGADFNMVDNTHNSPAHYFADHHKLKELNFFVKNSTLSLNIENDEGYTPLMMVFKHSYGKQLKSFTEYQKKEKFHSEIYNKSKEYYLKREMPSNSTESTVKYLLSNGSDKNELYQQAQGNNLFYKWIFPDFNKISNTISLNNIDIFKKLDINLNAIYDAEGNNIISTYIKNTPQHNTEELIKKLDWALDNNINLLSCNKNNQSAISFIKDLDIREKYQLASIEKEQKILKDAMAEHVFIKKPKVKRL